VLASAWEETGPISAGFFGVTDMAPGEYYVEVCVPSREVITGKLILDEASPVSEISLYASGQ